ncbi:MAG TPA: Gfo/Idh/MocA family oxidoreductase [Candidatus Binatia bacterium]|nr:Gfo/Idh/MocA family oxidoreductase [Candidatus Binatia bacterium]
MPGKRVRVGFVGGGRIADLQAIGWREHGYAEIGAICDVDRATRERRAREWGATAYERLEDLLADPAIDALEILTPHHLHAEQAIAALEAGKHVSLQKPPARDLAEMDRLGDAAERAARKGVLFRVFENFMWYPPHRLAERLVAEGAIGDVLSIRLVTAAGRLGDGQGWDVPMSATAWRMDPALCGGGMTTFDHGYHCFHMARVLVPHPVETVHAFIHWLEVPGAGAIDAPALITWRYAGSPRFGSWEVVASLDLAVRSKYYVSDDRIELRGSRGVLWINRCCGKLLDEPSVVVYADGETRAFHAVETDWAASFRDGTRDFVDGILAGRSSPLSVADARATLAFALAAQLSAREGREVRVADLG